MAEIKTKTLSAGHRKAISANDDAGKSPSKRTRAAGDKQKTLSAGHRKAIGLDNAAAAAQQAQGIVAKTNPLTDRYELLRDIPRNTIRKAWFTLSHLLLEPGAVVVDMGCQTGEMIYSMAALAPQLQFIGVDMDKCMIDQAEDSFTLDNLRFVCGDVGSPRLLAKESIDAIVNSFVLHEIYSGSHYNDRPVVQTLENQFALLKPGGIMYVRDFAMPSTSEYVLMEMPDNKSSGTELNEMSESDLLLWYSEHARPRQDPGCMGFFLEELPARFPKTRLFRLPAKWAYEFIMRKDERNRWEDELPKEYTFFTEQEYRKTLRALGSRVLYTAPHWDDQYVKACFDGHFRLYDENGGALGTPPTSFIAVAQKTGDRESVALNERRAAPNAVRTLRIHGMRNEMDGRVIDVISRDVSTVEILPWRMTETGDLNVFVHSGAPRGIVNAVPRNGRDLDGRRWSGHMTEAIAVSAEVISNIPDDDIRGALHLMKDVIGITPVRNRALEKGPAFYPAPDFIDERIDTRFIEVEKPSGPIAPRAMTADLDGFQTKGRIVELSAQSILNAISVGTIPNAQLELQIMALFEKLGMKAETWVDSPLALPEVDVPKSNLRTLLTSMAEPDTRFKKARSSHGQWRMLQSIFVEEGNVDGAVTGLASRNIDFAVSDENTENIAVILPLVKSLSGEVLAGYIADYLPVPQRHKGSGLTITAPTLALPAEIGTMDAAREYIADHFKVKPENVTKLGESYFCHIGVTPQRIYPFALTAPVSGCSGPNGRAAYAPLAQLWKLNYWDCSTSYMKSMSMAYKSLGLESDLSPTWDFAKKFTDDHKRGITTHATDLRGLGPQPQFQPQPQSSQSGDDESSGSAGSDIEAFIPEDTQYRDRPKIEDRKPLPK